MRSKISLKNRILMAYNGDAMYTDNKKYYKYSSGWTFIVLILTGWVIEAVLVVVGILVFFTFTTSLLFNFIFAIFIFPFVVGYIIKFLAHLLLPIQEITKEEYEQELEKINEQDKADTISKQEKKKSFFQRYKEYKKERGIK